MYVKYSSIKKMCETLFITQLFPLQLWSVCYEPLMIFFFLWQEYNSNPTLTRPQLNYLLTWILLRGSRCSEMINSTFPQFILGSGWSMSRLWWVCQEVTDQRLASSDYFQNTSRGCAGSYRREWNFVSVCL